jgi:hypothetical protein
LRRKRVELTMLNKELMSARHGVSGSEVWPANAVYLKLPEAKGRLGPSDHVGTGGEL